MRKAVSRDLAALGALSLLLTLVCLSLATCGYGLRMFISYFAVPAILWLNGLPILLLMGLWYAVTGRGWLAYLLTAVPVLALALVNYYKLRLRNDPLLFADLGLSSEAAAMAGGAHYAIQPTFAVIAGVVIVLSAAAYAAVRLKLRLMGRAGLRALAAAGCAAALFAYVQWLCPCGAAYAATANYGQVSEWSPTGAYVCRGVVFPFLRSIGDAKQTPPAGYDADAAAASLAALGDSDIPVDRKADVIAVMLEAFADFSDFPELSFAEDPYADWHALAAESYSGRLAVNIFAGDTVNTERAFLTGSLDPTESYRAPVNSFVWYFRGQGYACIGDHPCYNWFYNRLNVNAYLGFQQYHFYEDRYRDYAQPGAIAEDRAFLPTIVADYQTAAQTGRPVFSFNVTYQNHGPYFRDARYDTAYLPWRAEYDAANFNIANNYLAGVASTGRELRTFVNAFRGLERPVVIVLFGDHLPWWGDDNATYKMFGVNLDVSTEEGFYNYYGTPYLIWANDAAKRALGNDFTGDGGRLSPAMLMERLFTLAGWEGPAYLKALRALETHTAVINRQCYLDQGVLRASGADDVPMWLSDFRRLDYYWMHTAPVTD
ncbi:MAG: LTA synthase family protein [Clostridiales bacterium]|nr:LTA synthase family protein [Clostridiales bacterium]